MFARCVCMCVRAFMFASLCAVRFVVLFADVFACAFTCVCN